MVLLYLMWPAWCRQWRMWLPIAAYRPVYKLFEVRQQLSLRCRRYDSEQARNDTPTRLRYCRWHDNFSCCAMTLVSRRLLWAVSLRWSQGPVFLVRLIPSMMSELYSLLAFQHIFRAPPAVSTVRQRRWPRWEPIDNHRLSPWSCEYSILSAMRCRTTVLSWRLFCCFIEQWSVTARYCATANQLSYNPSPRWEKACVLTGSRL